MWAPERIWRLFATGTLYILFGVGSVFLGLVVMLPLSVLFFAAPRLRVKSWRGTIRFAFAAFVWLARWLGAFEVHFTNADGLREPGQMIIANHPSLLDVVILISRIPDVDCVIKHGLSKNPFVSLQVWMADYVRNDSAEEVVRECARRLDAGRSLIVFPEGTRSRRGRPLKFLRGTARTILVSNASLRPVVIHCRPGSLAKGDPWYRIPARKIRYDLIVRPCLDVGTFRQLDLPEAVRARHLTAWLEEWYTRQLQGSGGEASPVGERGQAGGPETPEIG